MNRPILTLGGPVDREEHVRARLATLSKAGAVKAMEEHIRKTWPVLFDLHKPLPLVEGVRDEIRQHLRISEPEMRTFKQALNNLLGRAAYHRAASKPGAKRYGLDGQPVGVIDDDQRKHHEMRLRRLKEKLKRSRAADPATRDPNPKDN